MRRIASPFLFLALISTVTAFGCNYCFNDQGHSCESKANKTCKVGERSCLGAMAETNLIPEHNLSLNMYDCTDVKTCLNGDFSINTADKKYFHMQAYCCDSQYCNAARREFVPYQDLDPNGLQCQAFFCEAGKTDCHTEMVSCIGNQTQCAKMKALTAFKYHVYLKEVIIEGCATPDVCTLKPGNGLKLGAFASAVRKIECYEAMPSSDQPDLGVKNV